MLNSIPAQHKRAAVFVANLKPSANRQEIPDAATPGLYLLMQPSGALSWAVRTKIGGTPAKITIGRYDDQGTAGDVAGTLISPTQALNVTQARKVAERVIADARRGNDPRSQKIDKTSINSWLDEFVKTARAAGFKGRAVKESTASEYERIIAANVKPHWKHLTDIRAIDYRDIEKLLAKVKPGARRNTYAVLSAFFRWKPVARAIGRNVIELAEAPAKPISRDRVLSHDEIKTVWKAAEKAGYPFGPMVQLLLLTGQRRDEIANLRWSELSEDRDAITLEGSRTKNGSAHIIPLAPLAKTIIDGLPKMTDRNGDLCEFVFSTTGETPYSGFSNGKKALDKLCGDTQLPDWHLHDLRRTCATELAKLGVKQEVTEAILNHKTGKVSGVAAIYNRYDYQNEKREALTKWADRITALTGENIAIFPQRKR